MANLNAKINDWRSQRVWVIGASSGIGAAFAQHLLKLGATVAVSARREAELKQVVAGSAQERVKVLPLDAADAVAMRAAYDSLIKDWESIDLVVFIAARYDAMRSWEINADIAGKAFDLNVLSVYRGLEIILPGMLARGKGRIALVASVAGLTGLPQATVYGATKAALINLAESLYFDLAPKGLAVHLIKPGFVKTPMTSVNDFAMPALLTPEEAAEEMAKGIAAGDFEITFPRKFTRWVHLVSKLPYGMRFALLHKATKL